MKRLLSILFLLTAFAVAGQAQTGCVELKEIDGSPDVKCVKTIRVTNGTLSCSGNVCTITISGGGGGSPGGSDTQLQYNNAGSFGGITGATTNGTVVTLTSPVLVTPAIGVATGTSLTVTGNMQVGIAALYKFGGSNSLSYTDSTGPKFTDGNTTRDLIFNVQSLSANRTVTWPDASGTATLLGNSSTGSGAVVLTGTPTIATPSFTTGFTIGGTAATGTIPRGNGTNFVASTFTMAAPGTSGNVLTSDGTNWTSAAPAGGGITIGTTTITSGTNTRVLFNNSGVAGEYAITGTGNVAMSASPTFTGTVAGAAFTASSTITQTSTSAASFTSGANGATNSTFTIDNSTASQASGITVAGKADGTAPTITVNSRTQGASALAGNGLAITADPAIAGNTNAGAAAGGSVTITAGAAARLTSGNANGGNINLNLGAGIGTGTAGQVLANVDGSASAPVYARSASTNTGIYFPGTNQLAIATNGNAVTFSGVAIVMPSAYQLNWNADTFLRRAAAANLALGTSATAASPVAQTISVESASGTNTSGATFTHIGSLGTSQGVPGRLSYQTGGLIAASGTTAQTAVSRLELGATKVLTNNSATTIVNVTNAANTSTGGVLDYCVEVTDGTDTQYECGMATYGISNKAGVFSGNTVTKFGNHQNATSGTLTVTIAISGANPGLLSVNANSSLTPSTGYPRITYSLRNLGQQAVAVQ